jgi:hypothetical protein
VLELALLEGALAAPANTATRRRVGGFGYRADSSNVAYATAPDGTSRFAWSNVASQRFRVASLKR